MASGQVDIELSEENLESSSGEREINDDQETTEVSTGLGVTGRAITDVVVVVGGIVLLFGVAALTLWPFWRMMFYLGFLLNGFCFVGKIVSCYRYVRS